MPCHLAHREQCDVMRAQLVRLADRRVERPPIGHVPHHARPGELGLSELSVGVVGTAHKLDHIGCLCLRRLLVLPFEVRRLESCARLRMAVEIWPLFPHLHGRCRRLSARQLLAVSVKRCRQQVRPSTSKHKVRVRSVDIVHHPVQCLKHLRQLREGVKHRPRLQQISKLEPTANPDVNIMPHPVVLEHDGIARHRHGHAWAAWLLAV
eukprot:3894438-Rhodomonas_salina.1